MTDETGSNLAVDVGDVHFRKLEERFLPGPVHGDSIRDVRSEATHPGMGYKDPAHLYLIYITRTNRVLDARRMWDYRVIDNDTDIKKAEEELLLLALGPKPTPAYLGPALEPLIWSHPCYFTIVLDVPEWKLYWGSNPGQDPLSFREYKPGKPKRYAPNYSFYNAKLVDVGNYKAVRCINYIKDENGQDLVYGQSIDYAIDILVVEQFLGGGAQVIAIDPDGQNQGPPSVP